MTGRCLNAFWKLILLYPYLPDIYKIEDTGKRGGDGDKYTATTIE